MATVERCTNDLKWKYLPLEIDSNDFIDSFKTHIAPLSHPHWEGKELTFKIIEGGISNAIVAIYPLGSSLDDCVLLRFNGNGTENFVNRELEILSIISLSNSGLARPLHCQYINGLCYGFVPGRPITLDEMQDMNVARYTAKTLAKLHHVPINPSIGTKPRLEEFYSWLDKVPSQYDNSSTQSM
jgi:ethanolamine kinase